MHPETCGRRSFLAGLAAILLSPARAAAGAHKPRVTVHKDPDCGCCSSWADHLKAEGFPVTIIETRDLNAVRARLGVPDDLAGCHTAELDGFVVEGHVPARAIERLLRERPQAEGLAVPGMPLGSPGMGGQPETYDVILFGAGPARSYGKFRGDREA
jgi:hypothetical protein